MCAWNVRLRRMFYTTTRATLATNSAREKTLITSWIMNYTRFGLNWTKMGQPKWIHQGNKSPNFIFCKNWRDSLLRNNCSFKDVQRLYPLFIYPMISFCVKRTLCYISTRYHLDVQSVTTTEKTVLVFICYIGNKDTSAVYPKSMCDNRQNIIKALLWLKKQKPTLQKCNHQQIKFELDGGQRWSQYWAWRFNPVNKRHTTLQGPVNWKRDGFKCTRKNGL